ncbi:PAS domain-containing protein [Desertivirga brevis]|uniref:PAS domain-containing protein n=1 Tax=Desertivirga brevis TaxID=2810310 RepID=UPI001A97CACE|nr:PAS domain S-box protein [Pedobacter sp. SYSU D00873]
MNTVTYAPSSITAEAIWSFDLSMGRFNYVSPQLADIFEVSLSTIETNPVFWTELIHPDDYKNVLTATKRAHLRKQFDIEYRICTNNKIKWVKDRRNLLLNIEGRAIAVSGILSDITVLKQTETRLSESELTSRYLFLNNPNPLWIYEISSLKFLEVNHAAIAMYGYTKDEFLSMTIADIRPAEDVDELLKCVRKVEGKFSSPQHVWRHRKKDREIIYVNISGHGIRYQGSDCEMVMVHDVSEQIKSKQEITLAKESLDALINNIEDQIWSVDSNYNLLSANISFKIAVSRIIGRDLILGESIYFPELQGKDAKIWKNHYDRALKGEAFQIIEIINYPELPPYCAETKFSPIKINDKIVGVACTSRNIQERLETQKRILEQNGKLLELISLVSHEIRGPIASIMGLTNIFNNKDYNDPFNAEVIKLIQGLTTELDSLLYTLIDKTYDLQQSTQLNAPLDEVD